MPKGTTVMERNRVKISHVEGTINCACERKTLGSTRGPSPFFLKTSSWLSSINQHNQIFINIRKSFIDLTVALVDLHRERRIQRASSEGWWAVGFEPGVLICQSSIPNHSATTTKSRISKNIVKIFIELVGSIAWGSTCLLSILLLPACWRPKRSFGVFWTSCMNFMIVVLWSWDYSHQWFL